MNTTTENRKPIASLEDVQSKIDEIEWYDESDERRLKLEVQQLDDGIGLESTYMDNGEFYDFQVLGADLDDALLAACEMTAATDSETIAAKAIDRLTSANTLLDAALRAVLDDRGVSELTIGKFYIYATVDGGADVLEGK